MFGVFVLTGLGFFLLFPGLKPDWIQINVGNGRSPLHPGGFRARPASWTPDPDSAEARFDRGMEHLENKEWDKAIAEFSEVIRQEPKNADAFFNRGQAWVLKDEWRTSISDFNAFVRLKPNDPDGFLCRAEALVHEGQTASAIADLDTVLRHDSSNVEVYCTR